jgi:aspartyl-tRNA synthetase
VPGPGESTHESVAAELDAIAASIGEGVAAEALDRRMRLAHDAVLALGREANQERSVSIALLVAALRAGAPPHPGMAQKLRDVATELRETARRDPA